MSMPVSMPVSMPGVERSERQDDGEFSPPSGDFMGKSAINEDFDRKIEFFFGGGWSGHLVHPKLAHLR